MRKTPVILLVYFFTNEVEPNSGNFTDSDIAATWLTSARLLRKGNFITQAYHSMLHAARLKDSSATIEHARLLWKDSHHRKAIQTLEGAIAANEFAADMHPPGINESDHNPNQHQNMLAARVRFNCTSEICERSFANIHRHIYCSPNGQIGPGKHSLRLLLKDTEKQSIFIQGTYSIYKNHAAC